MVRRVKNYLKSFVIPAHAWDSRKGVQIPYGSPFNILGNSVITLFPSFSFIVKIRFVLYLFFILKMRSSEPWVKHPSALFSCLRNRVPS